MGVGERRLIMWSLLVSPEQLAQARAAGTPVLVVDCRHSLADPAFGERAWRESRLSGALFLHLDRDLSGPAGGGRGRHPLPGMEQWRACVQRLGIAPQTQVVAYDDAGGMMAARLWWLLRWIGHQAVAVLDGGMQAWVALGLPVETGTPVTADVASTVSGGVPLAAPVACDDVLRNLASRECLVVDARSPDRYRGENETLDPVGGHIPGAVNRFFRDNLDADGRFKPATELRTEWLALLDGYRPGQVIHQCGSGVTACHNLLAMECAGLSGSRLYPGSWSEWCSDPARPVATG
jgi:thiosulfate/3-mercaptopyruvate sulfurtransferase